MQGPPQHLFLPNQFGIGIQSGAEIMVQTIRSYLDLHPEHLAIHAEVRNAFSSWNRNKLWQSLEKNFPSLSSIIRFSYANPTKILFSEDDQDLTSIDSTIGSRQGCTFGSFTFCLAMRPLLLRLQKLFPSCLILAYCDDLCILGPPLDTSNAYKKWKNLYATHMEGELRDDKGK